MMNNGNLVGENEYKKALVLIIVTASVLATVLDLRDTMGIQLSNIGVRLDLSDLYSQNFQEIQKNIDLLEKAIIDNGGQIIKSEKGACGHRGEGCFQSIYGQRLGLIKIISSNSITKRHYLELLKHESWHMLQWCHYYKRVKYSNTLGIQHSPDNYPSHDTNLSPAPFASLFKNNPNCNKDIYDIHIRKHYSSNNYVSESEAYMAQDEKCISTDFIITQLNQCARNSF